MNLETGQDPQQLYAVAMQCLNSGDMGQAERLLRMLLARYPNNINVLYGLAQIGFLTGRADLVISTMQRCIELNPNDGGSYHNLGNALRATGQHDKAIDALNSAIRLTPNLPHTYNTLGLTLKDLGRMDEAVTAFRKAVSLDPSFVTARSNLLMFLNYQPGLEPRELFEEHRRWSRKHEGPLMPRFIRHSNDRDPERQLRVGYVSADLRQHSVAYFLLPLLENHDRDQVHVTAYSNSAVGDDVTARIQQSVDAWYPIASLSDEQTASRIRTDGIDILVDLAGHTAGNRLQVFARRPAPVQITWLGYPGSTGMAGMDYRCSDPLADPPGDTSRFSSEEVLRLPRTNWCFDPLSGTPEVAPLPALTAPGVTFGSFNNYGKISEPTWDMWAEILRRTPGSRLVLKNVAMQSPATVKHAKGQLSSRGIAASRLDLLGQDDSLLDHLNRYNSVDLALDTFPYHGTTTTCEALWMGVPSIVLAGPHHASRAGVSLLAAVGLGDLVAQTPAEYVDTAVRLAADPTGLAAIRAGLRQRMLESPLMDGPSFARDMEAGYRQVWRAWCGQA